MKRKKGKERKAANNVIGLKCSESFTHCKVQALAVVAPRVDVALLQRHRVLGRDHQLVAVALFLQPLAQPLHALAVLVDERRVHKVPALIHVRIQDLPHLLLLDPAHHGLPVVPKTKCSQAHCSPCVKQCSFS